jgi:hypothetical protein
LNITNLNRFFCCIFIMGYAGCATIPEPKHDKFRFPKNAYLNIPKKSHKKLGPVRDKVTYIASGEEYTSEQLCHNYFNKSVARLLKYAQKAGGDAVMGIRSLVVYMDGANEVFAKPECFDDGAEGQVLTQGIAIKWLSENSIKTRQKE